LADSLITRIGGLALLAQAEGGGDALGGAMFPIMIGVTALLFYFLLLRPDQTKRKELEKLIAGLKKNDHVVTVGGIYGTVVAAAPDSKFITLRVDDGTGTKLRVLRSAIAGPAEAEPEGKPAE
jgi:preprotein translocase subunit YajC